MEESILDSMKWALGLVPSYVVFDQSIITFINTSLADLEQLGVGPIGGLTITDSSTTWDALAAPQLLLDRAKTLVYLKVKLLFDPPGTSFLLDSVNGQIERQEARLSQAREDLIPVPVPDPPLPEEPTW